jgi:hypothetical protein
MRALASAAGALLLTLVSLTAQAELGGRITTLDADQVRMKAAAPVRRITSQGAYSIHEITTDGGAVVREYAGTDGVIFAVSWQGPVKPNLQQLLGQYFLPFLQASDRASRTGPIAVRRDDLIVYSGGHPRAFHGHAYVRSLIPAGVSVDALQ